MSSLFYSQLSYQLERNIVNYLPQLESKEKRTHERSSVTVNHLIMSLFTFFHLSLSWKFGRQLDRKYASLAFLVYV